MLNRTQDRLALKIALLSSMASMASPAAKAETLVGAAGFSPSSGASGMNSTSLSGSFAGSDSAKNLIAQTPPSTTILPTDTLPLPAVQNRLSFAENLQLRILQKLPARFYCNATCETSFRYETNPFQFPTKRKLLTQLPPPAVMRTLNAFQQGQINNIIGLASNDDQVFRVLPNITGGWTITPKTRAYVNYFMIRDSLFHNIQLNTVIHSIGAGLQRDIPITSRGNLQAEIQFRELYQLHQQPVFDFLPGLTFSYVLTPRTVLFANALLQLRGKRPFQAPTREIDPFYTWGGLYQKNGWTFSATSTLVQNFREPFRKNASIPVNNYSFILDFEVSRRITKYFPGLQAFVRAEPIYNFHSHNRPGLAGMDFRLFYGLRLAMAKPALTSALEQLRQQLEEQESSDPENEPTNPKEKNPEEAKPSAFLAPHEIIASSAQPIHGFLQENQAVLTSSTKMPEYANNSMIPQVISTSEQKDLRESIEKADNSPKIALSNLTFDQASELQQLSRTAP